MTIKEQIEQDIKSAMLAGDKTLVTTLRGLKSTVLYAEVANGSRGQGLSDEQVIELLSKEAKKRQESADLYHQGGDETRAAAELAEKEVIQQYLPAQLSDEQLIDIVDETIRTVGAIDARAMGQIIAAVKQKVGATADGARIAQLVKSKLI